MGPHGCPRGRRRGRRRLGNLGARTVAQPTTAPIEIVSALPGDGGPFTPANTAPRMSDDGSIVVFDSTAGGGTTEPVAVVGIRNRVDDATGRVPDTPSLHPGISGDGCVVAYSVPLAGTGQVQLTALDRCTTASGPLVGSATVVDIVTPGDIIARVGIAGDVTSGDVTSGDVTSGDVTSGAAIAGAAAPEPPALPPPALSADGSVIVWSTGTEVVRYVSTDTGYERSAVITTPIELFDPGQWAAVLATGLVTGSTVDVSSDGNTVVFVAGPGTAAYRPEPANVFIWADADADPDPDPDAGTDVLAPVVELASMTDGGLPGSGDSTRPSVSGDGRLVLFESNSVDLAALDPAPAAAPPAVPFVVLLDRGRDTRVLADDAVRPTISTDGKVAVYDRDGAVRSQRWSTGYPFVTATETVVSTAIDGATSAGVSVSGPVVSAGGALVVFDSANGAALTTDVRFHEGTHVWARAQPNIVEPTEPTGPTTGPTGPTSVPRPSTTGQPQPANRIPPSGQVFPPETPPSTNAPSTNAPPTNAPPMYGVPVPPPRPQWYSSPSYSTGQPTGVFVSPGTRSVAVFEPSALELSPTVVEAGHRIATIEIANHTASSVLVTSTSIDSSDGVLTIADTSCGGVSLPPGGRCAVSVLFAPVAVGPTSATLVASFGDGTSVSALVSGTGAPPPVVTVTPGVASSGQVVAVSGAGFPAGVVVALSWLDNPTPHTVQVDDQGSFVETLVVMQHTPRGPSAAVVAAQPDLFATVVGAVLITETSSRSTSTLSNSAAGSPYGR